MERPKYILLILTILWSLSSIADNKAEIYSAYISNNMDLWQKVIGEMEEERSMNDAFRLELINYQYGYIAWCIGNENMKEAKAYLKKAEELADILIDNEYELSMVYAYKAAFVGYEIGIHNYKAPFIGSRSIKYAERSMEINPRNYLAWAQMANINFFTPSLFGGSKEKAIEEFQTALELYEESESLKADWNYLNLLSVTINACIEMEDYSLAKIYCEKALETEPSFLWVKDELYPLVLEKLKIGTTN